MPNTAPKNIIPWEVRMPEVQLNRMQAFQFLLILFAVPAQYFLYEWTGKTENNRVESIHSLLETSKSFTKTYLNFASWQIWIHQFSKEFISSGIKTKIVKKEAPPPSKGKQNLNRKSEESVAEEVFYHRSPNSFFATSIEPHVRKPGKVQYRVGQVIKHKKFGYHGVIVGWDETCKAPEFWIKQNHGPNQHWKNQPSYAVLVDTRDRPGGQTTYVVEENIAVILNTKIVHPNINDYFDFYDGAQYHMRPALQTIYPND
uniref:Uncharacterized protein LOC100178877 n=1 Tax=Phallusia mammillata TaxID=59560 RepID=A0A6F9DHK9_9ASCI|nr:uncharacterized protein LOC100178877 [Phallusia mammillata]